MISKQEYLDTPVGWSWLDHLELNADIYYSELERGRSIAIREQDRLYLHVQSFFESDENIACVFTGNKLELLYRDEVVLSVDTELEEHHGRIVTRYLINRVEEV